jgi:hypothetical protein
MVGRETDIQQLRTALQASRWQMHDNIQKLEEHFNVPRRLRTQLEAHPVKWAALALGCGIALATALPAVARITRRSGLLRLLSPAIRMALMAALPLLKRAAQPRTLNLE